MKKSHSLKLLVILSLFLSFSLNANAAVLMFDKKEYSSSIKEQFEVQVQIDPEERSVNAIEGEINYPKDLLILRSIETGDSIINFWIMKPQDKDGTIFFSGLIPGGFTGVVQALVYPEILPGTLFTLTFEPKRSGTKEIAYTNSQALLNDGSGTALPVTQRRSVIKIDGLIEDRPSIIFDDEPPQFNLLTVYSAMIDGSEKRFVLYHVIDKESGVDRVEILDERSGWKAIDNPYEIGKELLGKNISFRAYDNQGNVITASIDLQDPQRFAMTPMLLAGAIFIALLALLVISIKMVHRRYF